MPCLSLNDMRQGIILLVFAIVPLGWAQTQQNAKLSPEKRIEAWTLYLSEVLSLSPDQQAKVREILTRHREAVRPVREAKDREKLRELRRQTDAEIQAILTAEQKERYEVLKADWRARARAWYKARYGSDPGE